MGAPADWRGAPKVCGKGRLPQQPVIVKACQIGYTYSKMTTIRTCLLYFVTKLPHSRKNEKSIRQFSTGISIFSMGDFGNQRSACLAHPFSYKSVVLLCKNCLRVQAKSQWPLSEELPFSENIKIQSCNGNSITKGH